MLYCAEAGALFIFLPWSNTWDRLMVPLPWPDLRDLALSVTARSLVAAFGAVHLVWSAQDLHDWLSRRPRS